MKIQKMLIALLLVCSLGLCSCKLNMEFYIFADMEECRQLQNVVTEYTKIDVKTDKHLGDLKYIDYVAASCKAEDCKFKIYAYVFENEAAAKSYFKSVSTREATTDPCFNGSGGMLSYKFVAIDGVKAYSLYTSTFKADRTQRLLSKVFSVPVEIHREDV